ncbi:MAG: uracil-DNA glycosylase [Tenericutes bacterium HGW-Tenericutes-1]|jgi:uracil-DNA glycosylase|nr:MAG: uracil-DNA glycosylase [Tenericutes bacterium HGW-Tenericutes-1]
MINNDWDEILSNEFSKPYFKELTTRIKDEYKQYTCYPVIGDVFNAFRLTPFHQVKVVIVGQDPYHNEYEAMGLCFSVPQSVAIPPSLINIFTELKNDLGHEIPKNGDLTKWAKEGVLLLNTIMTVRKNQPLSHKDFGWLTFTDEVIRLLDRKKEPLVFVLWGSHARSKKSLLKNPNHLVIENVHPSPLSSYRGFFGSKPFSKINQYLIKNHLKPIDFDLSHEG